jgi:outer membrane protein, multidrug efflux system
MNMIKAFRLISLGVAGLMLQACSIPETTAKKVDQNLPDSFRAGLSQKTNTATVNWKKFFDDRNLLSLIDTAVANQGSEHHVAAHQQRRAKRNSGT